MIQIVKLIVVIALMQLVSSSLVFKESSKAALRGDIKQLSRASPEYIHDVVFAIKQNNLDVIETILLEVSTPNHEKFGKHLTREEVYHLTKNSEAEKEVEKYLRENGAEIVKKTPYGEYIVARGPISLWEKLFNSNFYLYEKIESGQRFVRAHEYSIDSQLDAHISTVLQTVQLPARYNKQFIKEVKVGATGQITPQVINSYYNVTTNNGLNLGSQAVFESLGQYYSPADLSQFQQTYSLPVEPIAQDIGGYSSDSQCKTNANNCAEANLDVQYMMGIAQHIPTTYWYQVADADGVEDFVNWILAVSSAANPPKVNSISYGDDESTTSNSLANQFDTEAMKLGVQGVTITVSSGDDGAPSYSARYNPLKCGYDPSYPASSNYVTAVGATQGAESNTPEVVCDSNTGGVITSGGGFSTIFTALSFQRDAIDNYLATVTTKPASGYSTTGRGFPDVSLAGLNYEVVIGGKLYAVSGTSASSPTFAAFVALVNSKRLSIGKSTLGYLNPAIYQYGKQFSNDVTVGNNKCTAGVVCCAQGFYAAPGWDPTVGFGGVNFGKFFDIMVNL